MTKAKIKNFSDFIPFIILILSALMLVWRVSTSNAMFMGKHIVGFFFLPIVFFSFSFHHKIGVLVLGLTLLMGMLSLLSYSYAVTAGTFSIGKSEDFQLPVFYGQPVFLLWLLLHFIVSGRHYVGIVTKKYWQDLLKSSNETTSPQKPIN